MKQPLALGLMTYFPDGPLQTLQTVRDMGIPTVQFAVLPASAMPQGREFEAAEVRDALAQTGVEITTVFCVFGGESYTDIPTVRATVGLVPEDTRAERVERIADISRLAQELGVERVAAHIGFIPEDAGDARYPALVETMRAVCDDVATRGQNFALETGQETAHTLKRFINDVARDNLRVNFDPANMILYGNDNPIEALDILAPWVDGVHCKDGSWPTEPNKLGKEKPLGEGAVDVPRWIEKLLEVGYRGPLTIEREIAGEEQKRDVVRAKALIEQCLAASEIGD